MSVFELDTKFVHKLADLLKETGLSEIEYAEGDKRIRVAAQSSLVQGQTPAAAAPAQAAAPTEEKKESFRGTPIEAPMVGTVYLAPEPGASPFVKVGDRVKAGDTLLIIEAMKVMNPIKAPVAGTISEILVSDAKPVEFGEVLMLIA